MGRVLIDDCGWFRHQGDVEGTVVATVWHRHWTVVDSSAAEQPAVVGSVELELLVQLGKLAPVVQPLELATVIQPASSNGRKFALDEAAPEPRLVEQAGGLWEFAEQLPESSQDQVVLAC